MDFATTFCREGGYTVGLRNKCIGGGWNSYTLQCDMWLWNRDSEITKWQHPTVWQVALGWHAIEFAQTSAILDFYIWFRFWPYHRSRHVILQQSPKVYPNRTTLGRKNDAILDFRSPIIGSLKCATSYRSSMDTVALNCLIMVRKYNKAMSVISPKNNISPWKAVQG